MVVYENTSDEHIMIKNVSHLITSISIAVLCGLVLYLCTPYGLGVSPDSVMYLAAARSLRAGQGLLTLQWNGTYSFMGHFPPIFTLVLALVPEVIQHNATILQAVLLFLSSSVVFLLTRYLHNTVWLARFMQLLFILSYPMLYVHAQVWSEPFLILGILMVTYFLIMYNDTKNVKVLVLLLLVTMLLPLIRYAALFLIPLVWGYVVCIQNNWSFTKFVSGLKSRDIKATARMVAFSLFELIVLATPYLLWGKYVSTQQSVVRSFAWHPITIAKLSEGANVVAKWFLPEFYGKYIAGMFLVLLFACMCAWTVVLIKNTIISKGQTTRLLVPISIVIGYICFLVLSITFFDKATPLDNRLLAPIYPLIMVVLAVGAMSSVPQKIIYRGIRIFYVLFVLATLYSGFTFIIQSHTFGQDYADREWRSSETIQAVKNLDSRYFLVSNSREGIYALTGKPAATLPRKLTSTGKLSQTMESEMKAYGQKESCVVFFDRKVWNSGYLPTTTDIVKAGYWPIVTNYTDGSIYCSK